jgi:hypothetical protein
VNLGDGMEIEALFKEIELVKGEIVKAYLTYKMTIDPMNKKIAALRAKIKRIRHGLPEPIQKTYKEAMNEWASDNETTRPPPNPADYK